MQRTEGKDKKLLNFFYYLIILIILIIIIWRGITTTTTTKQKKEERPHTGPNKKKRLNIGTAEASNIERRRKWDSWSASLG